MKSFSFTLRSLSRNQKLIILIGSDLLIAFFCWVVFGPPLALLLASGFKTSLSDLIYQNIISFIIPTILMFMYFLLFGFYRSLMKFFDSKDSIFRALIGSFVFGFSWGVVYISQYEIIRTDFLPTVILQALLLSSVFYAFIQITRDIARLALYPARIRPDGKQVLIY